jgi:hypothetical protein
MSEIADQNLSGVAEILLMMLYIQGMESSHLEAMF